jgi:hypothetical protein
MAEARVLIPRLTSPSAMRWVAATAVAVAGVLAYGWTTRPADRWAVLAIGASLAVGSVWAVSQRTWIEPSTGTVIRSTFWCLRRRVQLRAAAITLVDNRHGGLMLAVAGRRTIHLPVLLATDHVRRAQSSEILRLLAEQIVRHAPHAGTVAIQVRQLDTTCARLSRTP